jgi:3-isopropylmalate/(R)-2-methylmalate dehydratase small subunit
MEKFTRLTAIACPLKLAGIDTDQLVPARFMKRTRAEGYGPVLLHDLRQAPGFPLDNAAYKGARILVARRNFGGGSSREAAVYALMDYGIRCVIAPSFGDIFASNAVGNGLLPAVVGEADAEVLLDRLEAGDATLTVDLERCVIASEGAEWAFGIDPVWREKLLQSWDDVDLTRSQQREIDAFIGRYRVATSWAWLEERKFSTQIMRDEHRSARAVDQ